MDAITAAERFLHLNARVIDRRRFEHLFRGGLAAPVLSALAAYANPDGGYGHGLEPDLRGPGSQPVPAQIALEIMTEAGGDPAPVLRYLPGITTPEGGVPFVLPHDEPHGPWWDAAGEPPAGINPTAALAGLLYALGVSHPWLEEATAFSWRHIEDLTSAGPYDARCIVRFLDHVPDRERAEKAFAALRAPLLALVEPDPSATGHILQPLDLAPHPSGFARRLFPTSLIDQHLDALAAAQRPDGGWTVGWPIWTPLTSPEWRSVITIERLRTLRAYGRL